jgi:hypothetical protein
VTVYDVVPDECHPNSEAAASWGLETVDLLPSLGSLTGQGLRSFVSMIEQVPPHCRRTY